MLGLTYATQNPKPETLLLLPIDCHVLQMFLIGLGEDVLSAFAAGTAAHKEEIISIGGLEDGHNRVATGAGNRAGGQAGVKVGIIGRVDVIVFF